MSEPGDGGLRWGVTRRLEFIDFRLLWEGRVNRGDIADRFKISVQQASGDLRLYEEAAPHNLVYDRNQKAYLRGPAFRPRFVGDFTDRQLLQLMALESKWIRQEDTYFDTVPPLAVSAITRKRTTYRQLMGVLDAIRERRQILVDYQSINGPTDAPRWLAPHAIAYARGRWHARAWSRSHNDFRDFNLNRFGTIHETAACTVDPGLDLEWSRIIDVIVAPNPVLDVAMQDAIAMEYEMENGQRRLPTRLSLVFYLFDEFNFDVAPGILKPAKQQLVLLNRPEIDAAKDLARKDAEHALSAHAAT